MEKLDFTFLSHDQVFGNNKINVMKKYGTECEHTDFARLLGGDGRSWWTNSLYSQDCSYLIKVVSDCNFADVFDTSCGIRPVLKYSSISSLASDIVIDENGIKRIYFGEYPQLYVESALGSELDLVYSRESMNSTGRGYTTFLVSDKYKQINFTEKCSFEYEYKGNKYVRLIGYFIHSGCEMHWGDIYWVKVLPISWLVDEEEDLVIAEYSLLSGLPFNECRYYDGDFNNVYLKRFMNDIFAKDIIPSELIVDSQTQSRNGHCREMRLRLTK